jgi:hypothetical protein
LIYGGCASGTLFDDVIHLDVSGFTNQIESGDSPGRPKQMAMEFTIASLKVYVKEIFE